MWEKYSSAHNITDIFCAQIEEATRKQLKLIVKRDNATHQTENMNNIIQMLTILYVVLIFQRHSG